jgi:predicted ATPase/class 3 adenylate cyclase
LKEQLAQPAPLPDALTAPGVVTFMFTDVEGSTRLWETEPDRMRPAMARHDAIVRAAVEGNRGSVVKMTGDGIHAAFKRPLDALLAALEVELAMTITAADATPLAVRCGLHSGDDERRDNDFFGPAVNRAARIMGAAHGGQLLLSQSVAERVTDSLPAGAGLRDLGMVRLRDLTSPEHLYQVVHPQLRAEFPPLRSLATTPNNLAQQLNSFIGRERELAETRQRLAANRMLTLLGMGGIGKSRLSLQLAAEVLDDFPDGVWFVELAPLVDPRSVPQALASVLGVKEEAGRPVIEALLKYVRDKQLLVVLDNCEHVVHACADLAKQLMQAGPSVKVLTSSRDYLQIAGETTYHVPTLTAPDPRKKEPLAALAAHEAVRLFIDRVTAARPDFVLTEQNAAAVTDICHRLDGIPLAIELAAARARALSVENIAARLNDRFKLLVTGDRTVLPRQRTLRALIDWSYDLLDERERAVFQRLSVFAGGWTLEAAEAVCAGGIIEGTDVLDLQAQLVEKSLVVMEASGDRYRMLDTVQAYALEKMRASADETATRDRHRDAFVSLAERARSELFGPAQGAWLELLDRELENLMSAHAWCDFGESGAQIGLKLVFLLRPYWSTRGLLVLGHQTAVEALSRLGARPRTLARYRTLFEAGLICNFMGKYEEAKTYLTECLEIVRELGETERVARVLLPLGWACLGQGDLQAAREHYGEAVDQAKRLGNKRELVAATNALAQLYRVEGELQEAEQLCKSVIAMARELGDQESVAIGLLNLAMVLLGRGSREGVRGLLHEVLAIAEGVGSKPAGISLLEVCAGVGASDHDWSRAVRFFGAAEAEAERTGLRRDPTDEAFLAPLVDEARKSLGAQAFSELEKAARLLSYEEAISEARAWLGTSR